MIGERLKDVREYFDLTQNEIAQKLSVSRSTYAGWENNIDIIPLLKTNEFCNYTGVSLDYVFGLSKIKKYDVINENIDIKVLGKNLKIIRQENNDTQDKTANIIKVDQSNYSKYELGKIVIGTYPLIEFAKHYNISIAWICGKTNQVKNL